MKAIALQNPGPEYRLVLAEVPRPEPGRGEILIKVAAAGVNRADLLQAHGGYPPPPGAPQTLGLEVSGHVAALGKDCGPYKVGDAVCALLGGGGYAEYALAAGGLRAASAPRAGSGSRPPPCPRRSLPPGPMSWTRAGSRPAKPCWSMAAQAASASSRFRSSRRSATKSSPPRAATRNAACAKSSAPDTPSITEPRTSSR